MAGDAEVLRVLHDRPSQRRLGCPDRVPAQAALRSRPSRSVRWQLRRDALGMVPDEVRSKIRVNESIIRHLIVTIDTVVNESEKIKQKG